MLLQKSIFLLFHAWITLFLNHLQTTQAVQLMLTRKTLQDFLGPSHKPAHRPSRVCFEVVLSLRGMKFLRNKFLFCLILTGKTSVQPRRYLKTNHKQFAIT